MQNNNEIITVKDLVKKYGKLTAVDHISFDVKINEVFGILGPNGAGKTSTLEMIEGISPINDGQVIVKGIDVKHHPNNIKPLIGILLQSNSFFDYLTVKEALDLFGGFYEKHLDPMELLELVELKDKANSKFKEMSGGQQQRFAFALSLINDPEILFLDEPTTGLDPQSRRHMWDLIENIKGKGKTIVLTTHYMEEAEVLCQRVAIMDHAKIIALDTPANLVDQLLGRGFTSKVEVKKATLEDVFIDLTGHDLRE